MRVYTKAKGDKVLNYFLKKPEYLSINKDTFNTDEKTPVIFRGMSKSPFIKECVKSNIDFYYIDTGYFPQKHKQWHRLSKNNFQVLKKRRTCLILIEIHLPCCLATFLLMSKFVE